MSNYDKQYEVETELFGQAYKEFEEFVKEHAVKGATALDVGCGQGRDALMLAEYGYEVTGIDSSQTGIDQLIERAKKRDLAITGIVANFHEFEFNATYDAIVLDSILHFEKADRQSELALLDKLLLGLNPSGFMFVFVHKSAKKERELQDWLEQNRETALLIKEGYIDYVYEEKSTNFKSAFQMYMFILSKQSV